MGVSIEVINKVREKCNGDFGDVCVTHGQNDRLHRDHVPYLFQRPEGAPRECDRIEARLEDPMIGV
jgi:hypothetical protein